MCSAGSIWEPRSANYGTSLGTFIYYEANPEVMDTSKVLLSLKGGNTSRTRSQERLYHTCIQINTGRRAALSHFLILVITPLDPSLHHFPPLCFLSLHWNTGCVYILPTQETSANLWSAWSYSKIVVRWFSVNTHIVQIRAWRQGLPVCFGSFTALLDEQSLCKWQYSPFLANSLRSICKKYKNQLEHNHLAVSKLMSQAFSLIISHKFL